MIWRSARLFWTSRTCHHRKQRRSGSEAYINDVVVKSKKHWDLLDDIKETFNNLRKYKMMLNSKKFVFGVSSGKLLGYMVSA
jgi:hypothetical protein